MWGIAERLQCPPVRFHAATATKVAAAAIRSGLAPTVTVCRSRCSVSPQIPAGGWQLSSVFNDLQTVASFSLSATEVELTTLPRSSFGSTSHRKFLAAIFDSCSGCSVISIAKQITVLRCEGTCKWRGLLLSKLVMHSTRARGRNNHGYTLAPALATLHSVVTLHLIAWITKNSGLKDKLTTRWDFTVPHLVVRAGPA